VLLGRAGGVKSCVRVWSRGGLEGPGETGLDAVAMIEASSIVALPSSSSSLCTDMARSCRSSRLVSIDNPSDALSSRGAVRSEGNIVMV
jgi:hypothetical protein